MRSNEPQILTSILEQKADLLYIQEKTITLAALTLLIDQLLPKPLNQHCRVANYRQHILIIEVSSASWLTHLKYQQSHLLTTLRSKSLPALASIQYKINPDIVIKSQRIDKHTNSAKITNVMTQKSSNFLYALAENAPEQLKKQLIKLANHAK